MEDGVARTPAQRQEGFLVTKLQPTRHFRGVTGVPWRTENWRDRETRHGRECHVCNERVYCHPEVHVLQIHLPWFTRSTTACFRCGVQEDRGYTLCLQHLHDLQTHPVSIEFNCHFGFMALIRNADPALKRQISRLAVGKILLESDAPYLTPPAAHSMNTPWHTQYLVQILADIRGKSFSLILAQTTVNARRLCQLN